MKDWEACYKSGETPWDKGLPAPPLVDLIDRIGTTLFSGGPVLIPGCGLGHDVRLLADLGIPSYGLDISQTAVASASGLTQQPGAHFEHGDFLDPAWSHGRKFKAIWEHTCFCAIDPTLRNAYARAVAAVLDPGGIFAGVFYLTPSDPGDDDSGPPFETSIEELDALFSPWFERIDGWVPERCYPGREGREWIGIFRKLPHLRVVG